MSPLVSSAPAGGAEAVESDSSMMVDGAQNSRPVPAQIAEVVKFGHSSEVRDAAEASQGVIRNNADGLVHMSEAERFRQMQMDMLRKENLDLSSKLDFLTTHLRSSTPPEPSTRSTAGGEPLYRRPANVGKTPTSKDLDLVFEGGIGHCDKAVLSAKLLHVKRLLQRRLTEGLLPTRQAMVNLLDALMLCEKQAAPQGERIRIISSVPLSAEAQSTLKNDIILLVGFTQGTELFDSEIVFQQVDGSDLPSGQTDMVLVVGHNYGHANEQRIEEATLSELIEPDSVAWARVFGDKVKLAWLSKDMAKELSDETAVVCSSNDKNLAVEMYYPSHVQAFMAKQERTNDKREYLQWLLSDHIDSISFQEWTSGVETSGTVVPVKMPTWIAVHFWELATHADLWLSFLTTVPTPLRAVRMESLECDALPAGASTDGGAATSVQFFFELERQQELIRRKVASLERLMKCKQFVANMETFTSQLQHHAEELFSGIRLKQETPNTLDALCNQLSSLSVECEKYIDQAMNAVEEVGEAPWGADSILEQQMSKIGQARRAKDELDRIKSDVQDAMNGKQKRVDLHISREDIYPAQKLPAPALRSSGSLEPVKAAEENDDNMMDATSSGIEPNNVKTMVMGMLGQLNSGLQVHKEQQQKLVDYWLGQHATMRSELNTLRTMANDAANVESIGVNELHEKFQKYIDFLEEHEEVEDTVLFPLVKTMFPESTKAVDTVLDPQRHKGVDALNARVGKMLRQLHEKHSTGQEMAMDTKEMKKIADALDRLNDYMVGHIRFEEEVTMPWLSSGHVTVQQPMAST